MAWFISVRLSVNCLMLSLSSLSIVTLQNNPSCLDLRLSPVKVRKTAKIRKRYNQVPHLTQDTTMESRKTTIKITNKSQEASHFPAGDQGSNEQTRKHEKHKTQNTYDPQKKYRLGAVSKNILLEGLTRLHRANFTLSSDVDQDT